MPIHLVLYFSNGKVTQRVILREDLLRIGVEMKNFLIRVVLAFMVFGSIPLAAEDHSKLKTDDIQKVMSQIFQQHVSKKAMTDPILQNSFRAYIDQFDPDRVYLLQSEISPI